MSKKQLQMKALDSIIGIATISTTESLMLIL